MSQKCTTVNASVVCGSGARANVSTITGVVNIKTSTTYPNLPNMYDTLSVLTLQGLLTAALTTLLPSYNLPLFGLNYTRPLQVEIVDYTYFNATGQVSSTNGVPLTPPDADYLAADRGVFTFVFVLANVDSAAAAVIQSIINSNAFSGIVQNKGSYFSAAASSSTHPGTYLAEPYPTDPEDEVESSSSAGVGAWTVVGVCGFLLIVLALIR